VELKIHYNLLIMPQFLLRVSQFLLRVSQFLLRMSQCMLGGARWDIIH
jgi:hypothetical protein